MDIDCVKNYLPFKKIESQFNFGTNGIINTEFGSDVMD
jgi:hypothetical protein